MQVQATIMAKCWPEIVRKINEKSMHTRDFLMDEIRVLDDAKAIALPNFLPRHAFVLLTTKRACQNLMEKMREQSTDWVSELVEMEKLTDYTCNPEYLKEWNMLMSHRQTFLDDVQEWNQLCVRNLVSKELEKEIVTELMATNGGKLELLLEEAPSVAAKRKRLNASIELLREAKDVLSNIMGNVSA
ncbi:hypothetical protein NC651_001031 [Populus alba x Populus x berolinensis]|nr:hypothetical protein NC651_001031 [Populus alba x Populus x berolinensis]